ncbi:MAG: hypothetical protein Q9M28_08350, partial [Mariprofundaceae bacterium]|nr:hypothetical protein [Mariprofundaceae bacterium]
FVLFVLMAFLVRNNNAGLVEVKPPVVITVYQTPDEQNLEIIDMHELIPPVVPKMPPQQVTVPEESEGDQQFHYQAPTLTMETQIRGLGINAVSDQQLSV